MIIIEGVKMESALFGAIGLILTVCKVSAQASKRSRDPSTLHKSMYWNLKPPNKVIISLNIVSLGKCVSFNWPRRLGTENGTATPELGFVVVSGFVVG